jgi:TetR/AcrR family transcriptional regulator
MKTLKQSHPLTRNCDGSRAAILQAAEGIFAEQGLDGARTDAIARRAGVNKALLYYYFKSKERLYLAVLDEHRKEFFDRAVEILSHEGPAAPILLQFVEAHFDFITSHRHYAKLFQRSMLARDIPSQRQFHRRIVPLFRKVAELVERGMHDGEFRSYDVTHTVISMVALTVFYFGAAPVLERVSGTDPLDEENIRKRRREVLRFIRYALFNQPEGVGS